MKYLLLLLLAACAKPGTTWSGTGSPTPDVKEPVVVPPNKCGECTIPPVIIKVPLTAEDIKKLCSKECDITEHYGYIIHMKGDKNVGEGCFCKKLILHHEDNHNFLEEKRRNPKTH